MMEEKDYIDIVTPYGKYWKEDIDKVIQDTVENKERKTVLTYLVENATKDPTQRFLAWRPGRGQPYVWMTREEVRRRVFQIGAGLRALFGTRPHHSEQARVGIFSPNCPDWTLSELGAFTQNICTVPMYPTCGAGTLDAIIRHAELSVVFCYASSLPTLLGDIAYGLQKQQQQQLPLRTVILIGNDITEDSLTKTASEAVDTLLTSECRTALGDKFKVITLNNLIALGTESPNSSNNEIIINESEWCRPESVHSIIYTSGSEGRPKGVVLTHQKVLFTTRLFEWYPDWKGHLDEYIYFSYLPLAHSFEREVFTFFAAAGSQIAFCSGIPFIADDMRDVRPHVMMGVPRIWKRLHDSVESAIDALPFYKRWVLRTAIARKVACEQSGVSPWVDWDALGVRALAVAALGGNLKVVISGAAAVDPALVSWFSAVFGCKFFQGYGLTETFGSVTVQHTGGVGADRGTIGAPCPGVVARLRSVPDMGYLASADPPCGELCIKAPSVMVGYFKDPELTAETIDAEGFVSTGDIARLNPDSTLSIIDRKKSIKNKTKQNIFIILFFVFLFVFCF